MLKTTRHHRPVHALSLDLGSDPILGDLVRDLHRKGKRPRRRLRIGGVFANTTSPRCALINHDFPRSKMSEHRVGALVDQREKHLVEMLSPPGQRDDRLMRIVVQEE